MEDWHIFSVEQTAQTLKTSVSNGLSDTETKIRLQKYGLNKLIEGKSVHWYHMLLRQFMSILILILIIAAGLSFFLGDTIDALAIFTIIILNGLLGFAQEWKAETSLQGLKKMLNPRCRVIRDGNIKDMDTDQLVPGDFVLLESGNMVPADIRLTHTINLKTDEASLTGESTLVKKDIQAVGQDAHISEKSCIAWTGTHIVNGCGQGIVIATGMETEFGRIAQLTDQIRETSTRLQQQLSVLGKQLALMALSVSLVIVVIGWLSGKPLAVMFMAGVSLAVSAVPEGLPAVVTITLALGVGIMSRRKALLRHLQAAETLGAVSVICTDKTGTLTKNEMTIQKVWMAESNIAISGTGYDPNGIFSQNGQSIDPLENPDLKALLETGYKCNHARLLHTDTEWHTIGSPTEAAFIVLARKAGLEEIYSKDIFTEFSFNSTRKRMSVVEKNDTGFMVHLKGAPEVLLSRSSRILINGKEHILDDRMKIKIEHAYHEFAQNGLRTMALARKILPGESAIDEDMAENDLIFLGIVGIIDPPRSEIREAIEKTYSAGIRVIMVTGDSPDTAMAIAKQIGLKAEKSCTGAEFSKMSDDDAFNLLKEDVIFARTVPEDKFRIVKLLQSQSQLVAMTGDGVNDAPALKQADIGIAMGIRGTDVAKGASDMVLTDDNFASIVSAIEEGRRQYANIRKFVRYLTSSNIGETLAIFISILLGLPLILLPIQILWVNLVTDSVTALSLSVEKAEANILKEPPRSISQPILDKRAILILGFFGSYIGIMTFMLFQIYLDESYALANSVAFTGMVLMANIHALNFRNLHSPLHHVGYFSNPWLLIAIIGMLGLQICAVYTPFLQQALNTVPLGWSDWGIILAVSLPLIIVTEIYKTIQCKRHLGSDISSQPICT